MNRVYALLIYFTTVCSSAIGQIKYNSEPKVNCVYDSICYKRALDIIKTSEKDSLLTAYTILRQLHKFDSLKYSTKILAPYYSEIEGINLSYLKSNIIGEWNFEWSGNCWGTGETYITKHERIRFSDDEIYFYEGDSLVRKTTYYITNAFSWFKEFKFQVFFDDDKTTRYISIKKKNVDSCAHLMFSKRNVALIFDLDGICGDCGYSIYMKKRSKNYRLNP